MKKNKSTQEVAIILGKRDTEKYKEIIVRAANNGYHDFKFDNIPNHPEYGECICPKSQLVEDLAKYPELKDVRQMVINGDFDEHPDAEDNLITEGMMINEGVPDEMFKALGFEVPTKEKREMWLNKGIEN